MKFFFESVFCCRSAVITTQVKTAEQRFVPLNAASVPNPMPVESRRKLSRMAASRSGSAGDWRPALNAISEDNVVVVATVSVGSERITKKRKVTLTHSPSKVQVRNCNDFRRASFSGAMVPAFTPSPFFF